MNKEVNFEIAKLVEEKGFQSKGPIAEYWEVDGRRFLINTWEDEYDSLHHEDSPDDMIFLCAAPTIAEVVMWLYEKHGIWIYIKQGYKWEWYIETVANHPELKYNDGLEDSPTEAYEEAIIYTLENLI